MNRSNVPSVSDMTAGLSAYQQKLSVSLIATPRQEFITCSLKQSVSDAHNLARSGDFDHVPVAEGGDIVGVLDLRSATQDNGEERVESRCEPLAEKYLIGADISILDFVEQAHEHPFRLLVTRQGISGLVSISDIQQLAARAALFALVTQLEISMARVIRRNFRNDEWAPILPDDRLIAAKSLWEKAREASRQVDLLNYTQFCDKTSVLGNLVSSRTIGGSKKPFRKDFERFRRLRDDLAHANDIEASEVTCRTVRSLREWIEKLEEAAQ